MPGIVGFSINTRRSFDIRSVLSTMRDLMTHSPAGTRDELFMDGSIAATGSYTSVMSRSPVTLKQNEISAWMDGEVYNGERLALGNRLHYINDIGLIVDLYRKNGHFSFLRDLDGIFSAVLYDTGKKRLYIFNDRYGLRHIYYYFKNGIVMWSSEFKAFLAHPTFCLKIDRKAVGDFFSTGYILGDKTWFDDVTLLPSGTILEIDLGSMQMTGKRYWYWDEIKKLEGSLDEDEIAEEMGRLFKEAVRSRCRRKFRFGLALSGGLDSRAILAALPDLEPRPYLLTFGNPNSDDVHLASRAAGLSGLKQELCEINEKNWLKLRLKAVWWNDGQQNLMHMHGIEALERLKSSCDVCLNGFLGDALLGGLYINDPVWNPVEKFNNRARRFIVLGPRLYQTEIEVRFPFAENSLVDFAASIPDALKEGWHIYKKMLLMTFPRYFKSIPWQKTGYPIGWSKARAAIHGLQDKINLKMSRLASILGIPGARPLSRIFTDYANWIRKEPARSFFVEVLKKEDAIYREYIKGDEVERHLAEHLAGEDRADMLCRYLTLEIWLRQIFQGRYRS